MSTRPTLIVAGLIAVTGLAACQSRYSDVYSFKKNSFQPPVSKTLVVAPPTGPGALDPMPAAPVGGAPNSNVPGIPGVPGVPAPAPGAPAAAPTGIPGLDPAPAPAPK